MGMMRGNSQRQKMTLLLYFTSFCAVLALFASAITIIVWMLVRLVRALRRLFRPAAKPAVHAAAQRRGFLEDTSLQRAGR